MMRATLVDRPIDLSALCGEIANPRHGALTTFIGTVRNRNDGRAVVALDYSAYPEMAERELERIATEAVARWPECDLLVEHRVGHLALGDTAVAVVAAAPHRDTAFAACRYLIEEVKRRVPVWKREHYADGTREWVNQVPASSFTPPK